MSERSKSIKFSQLPSILLLICGALLVCFYQFPEIIFFGNHFGHPDFLAYHYPIKRFFFESIKSKFMFATFYPNNLQGISLLHNPVHQILSPLNIYWLVFDFDTAAKLQWITSNLILVSGCFCLIGFLKFDFWIAAIVSLSVLSSGLVWSTHIHPTEIDSLAWMPWILYFYLRTLESSKTILELTRYISCAWLCVWIYIASGDPWGGIFTVFFCVLFRCFSNHDFFRIKNIYLNSIFVLGCILIYLPWVALSAEILPILDRGFGFLRNEQFWYSSHPVRLLEWFFGFLIPPLHSQYYFWPELRKEVFPSWWYYHLYLGFPLALVFLLGSFQIFYKTHKRSSLAFLISVFLLISFFSFGKFNVMSEWIWTQTASLHKLRFPERLLKYNLLSILILSAYGFQWLFGWLRSFAYFQRVPSLFVFTLLILQLFEVSSHFVISNTTKEYSIQDLRPPVEFLNLKSTDRILVCSQGIDGRRASIPLSSTIDPRSWGMATVVAPDSMTGPMMKLLDCTWATTTYASNWLGYSHVITPYFEEEFQNKISKDKSWVVMHQSREKNFVLFLVDENALKKGFVISSNVHFERLVNPHSKVDGLLKVNIGKENFEEMTKGHTFIDPNLFLDSRGKLNHKKWTEENFLNPCGDEFNWKEIKVNWQENFQKLTVDYNLPCDSWVILPWAFVPGWQIKNPTQHPFRYIYRFNDQGLAVRAYSNQSRIEISR